MTTPLDPARAEFEALVSRHPVPHYPVLDRKDNGGYIDPVIDLAWEAWQAAIASRAAPEGWQLVPPTPTEEMHVAAVRTIVRCTGNDEFPGRVWRAMLAAAPTPPTAAKAAKETT